MAQRATRTVLGCLRKLIAEPGISQRLDHQLLQQFVTQRDESVFAELVRRHGPMVIDAARCVLHNLHDAEDVFQATFLVLARKADSIRKQNSLASWLYGVAYRLAMKARATGAKRKAREQQTVPQFQSSAMDEMTWRELRLVLHEELHRLPEKYRAPLLLCYFEGKSQDEAARHLGWNKWTLKNRLEQARDLLRVRLTRRGLIPSAVLFATLLSHNAASAVPAALLESTLNAAMMLATGQTVSGAISAEVAALVELSITGTFTKAKLAVALLLTFCMVAAGAGLATYQAKSDNLSEDKKDSQPNSVAQPPLTPQKEDQTRTDHYGDPLPANALLRLGTVRLRHGDMVRNVGFSPDGKKLITADWHGVHVWDANTGRHLLRFGDPRGRQFQSISFSADGRTVALTMSEGDIDIWDATTGRRLRQFHTGRFPSVILSPDGMVLAVLDLETRTINPCTFGMRLPGRNSTGCRVTKVRFTASSFPRMGRS